MNTRKFTHRNESFICAQCGEHVPPSTRSCRNHCPYCLYSIHLDVFPGDRAAQCGGLMVPVRVVAHSKKGFQVVHQCAQCGAEGRNVLRLDDEEHPDSLEAAMRLMQQP